MERSGKVFYKKTEAGRIWQDEEGYNFVYAHSYLSDPNAEPVSLTLPLRKEPYAQRTMIPFFDGLIPEGWLLEITVKNWKIDRSDRMGLLLTACKDCIGAVSIEPNKTEG